MSDRRTPDLFVEQALLGERETSPADAARVVELSHSNADILKRYPPRVVAMRVRGHRQKAARAWAFGGSLVVAAAALTLVVLPAPVSDNVVDEPTIEPGVRKKGLQPELQLFRVTDAGAQQLDPEAASAHEGDRLQLSYIAGEDRYGVVFSVDGRGTVTVHMPLSGSQAVELSPEGATILGSSYALDDAPAYERFFFVTSAEPFTLSAATTAAEQLAHGGNPEAAALGLPPSLHQTSFLVLKR